LSLKLYAPGEVAVEIPGVRCSRGWLRPERIFEFLDAPVEIQESANAARSPVCIRRCVSTM
jgi:hypothetical protein